MSELKTRRATDHDAEGLSVLLRDYLRERYPSQHGTSIEQLRRDVLGDPGGQRVAVGQHGSDLVGFIAWDRVYDLHWGLKGVQIADLYVVPAFRGRGIALILLVGLLDQVTTRDYPLNVKAVGVKNLKARLSEHLRSVKAGETILVTERDQVIAELRPARGTWYAEGPLDMALATLADAGELSPPAVSKGHWTLRTPGLGWPRGSALDLLDGVRDDRV